MKKTICILLILSLVLGLCLVLVGCNKETIQHKVTIIKIGTNGRPNSSTAATFYVDADTPLGNNFKYQTRDASDYTYYTDKGCTIQWNIVKDKVNCDMTLYAVRG